MQVAEWMTREFESIDAGAPVRHAAQLMRDLDVGTLPVHQGTKLVGMVTDRDIAVRAVARGKDPEEARVAEVMTADLLYCYEDEPLEAAARVMEEAGVRRVVVLTRGGEPAGIVSVGDLARASPALGGKVLEAVSRPRGE